MSYKLRELTDVVTKLGYYLPWAFASSVIMTVGNGLVSTFTRTTSVATWIGFQIVLGAGRGLGMQTVRSQRCCEIRKAVD